jgi:fructosamine-3-kinase
MLSEKIIEACGFSVERCTRVSGGDINDAFCIFIADKKYFLKVNDASEFPGMFEKEAKGLKALSENCTLNIPQVIKNGAAEDEQFLLLEWMENGPRNKNFWEDFGGGLAKLHLKKQEFFGWEEDNYIGSLVQANEQKNSWAEFYSQHRIMPLVKKIFDSGMFAAKEMKNAELLCSKLDQLFPNEHPSLLHGDLWSGNFMCSTKGPAIFDPAVYCGHREMDLGMCKLFGGFDNEFYEAYHQTYPLEKDWQKRIPLTQLYPLLVHAVLFGGGYASSAADTIRTFV